MGRKIEKVLVTGAAGGLGNALRGHMKGEYALLRLSDINEMRPADRGEEVVQCDLADRDAVVALCEGMDAIIHFGGFSHEADWDTIHSANILGAINLWEGARIQGVDRVVFASSNHAIGLYRRDMRLDHTTPPRPDGRYGLSKAFGEDLAALYAYKFGVRGFCVRIGSCFDQPVSARMLHTWQSRPDLARLVRAGLTAEYVFEIVYGVSDNSDSWWDNSRAYELGYAPQDSVEQWRAQIEGIVSTDPIDATFQGGPFAADEFVGEPKRVP